MTLLVLLPFVATKSIFLPAPSPCVRKMASCLVAIRLPWIPSLQMCFMIKVAMETLFQLISSLLLIHCKVRRFICKRYLCTVLTYRFRTPENKVSHLIKTKHCNLYGGYIDMTNLLNALLNISKNFIF